jgi:4-amino-4-deoxy-L-arabinose transferase-like glycosyltransferase
MIAGTMAPPMTVSDATLPPRDARGLRFWTAWGLAGLLGLFVFYMTLLSGLNRDELEAVHTAWKILHGERIYADFVQHHHPLLYVYLVPVIAVCGEHAATVIACRIAILPFFAGIVILTWLLARRLFDQRTALVAAACLLLSWPFLYTATEIRPDVPEVLLGMAALLMLYPQSKGPGSIVQKTITMQCSFVIGLCLGLSFLFLQKAIFYIAAVTLVLLVRILRREVSVSAFFTMWAGICLAVLPFAMWLISQGMLGEYFFLNWTVNAYYRDQFSFVPFAIVVAETQPAICIFALAAFVGLWIEGPPCSLGWCCLHARPTCGTGCPCFRS